jgi:hypothetical protein
MQLRLTWRYVLAFAALTILCGTSHEFVHHFAGAAICGGFGVKTFNSFDLAPGCDANPLSRGRRPRGRSSRSPSCGGASTCSGAPTSAGGTSASR